jgi:hypothetical protein
MVESVSMWKVWGALLRLFLPAVLFLLALWALVLVLRSIK